MSVIRLGVGEGFVFEWNTTVYVLSKSGLLSVLLYRVPNVTDTSI